MKSLNLQTDYVMVVYQVREGRALQGKTELKKNKRFQRASDLSLQANDDLDKSTPAQSLQDSEIEPDNLHVLGGGNSDS